jgi:Right handed beta helix region/Chlamydia polymorphic membrane protein (Chlamydia_PMP) repeat
MYGEKEKKMKKFLILTVLAVLLSATNLFAECTTYVSGTIVNETWTLEGSPYCVEGDILVASLTIEPGVRVEFIGNYVFEVAGTLTAIGTEENEIVFTAQETNEDGWQGIFFNYSSPGSELAYCTIEDSINSGIRTKNITLIIKNCTITNNSGTQGAGIYANGGEIILMSCTIEGNSVSVTIDKGVANGGGIYISGNLTLINSTVSKNFTSAYYHSTKVYDRWTYSNGGGIYVSGNLTLTNSIICENYAYSYAYSKYGTSYADSRGGGIYFDGTSLNATNCIISNNSVIASAERHTKKGGGIYLHSGTASFTNCTVAYNENQGLRNEGGTATAMNCIFWKNSSTQISGTTTVTYSDVEDGYPGEGNISSNPIFNVCIQIFPFSPCIDRGNPDSQYNDTCLPPSLEGIRNDMGAHGGPGACEWIYCDGDFDCDIDIDGSDLSVFAADFGRTDCDDDCEEDFDNDGDVDGSDWAVFAANFDRTDCCPK